MKIPNNMSEESVIETINNVISRISPRYTFNCYDVEDIKQEAFIICMDALNRYDPNRPLENFLSVNLSNRLKNFIRDNNGHCEHEEKKKVNNPTLISESFENVAGFYEFNPETIDDKNLFELIDQNIPSPLRSDFLKFINGVYIPKNRKLLLFNAIKEILDEKGTDI